jgi:hypothetical protein
VGGVGGVPFDLLSNPDSVRDGTNGMVSEITRNPKPETRNPKPETRNPRPETRNPKPETRNPKPETRNPKPAKHGRGTDRKGARGALARDGLPLERRHGGCRSVRLLDDAESGAPPHSGGRVQLVSFPLPRRRLHSSARVVPRRPAEARAADDPAVGGGEPRDECPPRPPQLQRAGHGQKCRGARRRFAPGASCPRVPASSRARALALCRGRRADARRTWLSCDVCACSRVACARSLWRGAARTLARSPWSALAHVPYLSRFAPLPAPFTRPPSSA